MIRFIKNITVCSLEKQYMWFFGGSGLIKDVMKQMERLTKRYIDKYDGRESIGLKTDNSYPEIYFKRDMEYQALEKLATYEDLEEQGLLVRLPCKVGDTLYCIDNGIVELLIVNSFRIYNFNRIEIDFENASGFTLCTFSGELDEGYFLTREEAEKKLEEMKKND